MSQCHRGYVSVRYQISTLHDFIGDGRTCLAAMEPCEDGLSLVGVAIVGNHRLDEALLSDGTHQLPPWGDRGSVRIPLLVVSECRAFGAVVRWHIGWRGEDE